MASSLFWLSPPPTQLSKQTVTTCPAALSVAVSAISRDFSHCEEDYFIRRRMLIGLGTFTSNALLASFAPANEVTDMYKPFVDCTDGYSYVYPSDWREFDFLGHDSAFKDRVAALQHVRVGFIPTTKNDIRDLGPMQEVIFDIVKNVYAAPTQKPTIYDIQERTIDGKNYWTFEYDLESPGFTRTAFATLAIGNGRYYTLVVGANQRRWSRLRSLLKVVADSFKILDIKPAAV
uniref:PsbP-like protein 2 n=1 Tax=Habenaria pantlingiana TaxID=1498489 RepID=A0A0F7GX74_9ASPA